MIYFRNFLLKHKVDPVIFYINCLEANTGFDEDDFECSNYLMHSTYEELIRFIPIPDIIGNAFEWCNAMQQPECGYWSTVNNEWYELTQNLSPSEINLNILNTHLHTHRTKAIHVN